MTAAAKATTPDVAIERETGPQASGLRSLYRIIYQGQWVGWLVLPNGWGECFRIHSLLGTTKGGIVSGERVGTYYGRGSKKSKDEAIAAVADLVEAGKLFTADVAQAAAQERAEAEAASAAAHNEANRAENKRRGDTITGLTEMLARPGISDADRTVLESSLRYVQDDIPELRVKD